MNKAIFATILCCFAFFTVASGAVNFPYPQESSYSNGAIVTSSEASAALKAKFESFFGSHYENSSDNTMGRIKWDTQTQTVSEGIGYGMIMMVYFSDASRSYQAEFDRLWKYYNNFLNQNGLMNWKINGFTGVAERNAATDAEFDVAFALEMAYYQFGDQKYLDDAATLIGKIKQKEMETSGLHKPGDMWNSKRNPSYVSPAAFELFKRVDDTFWTTALSKNYALLKANQNQTTGLPSDWCNDNGGPIDNNNFGYDASRAPWRWAWGYAWFGHQDAKDLLDKLAAWVSTKEPKDIKGGNSMSVSTGQGGTDNNSTFIGPLLNSMQVSSSYQDKINTYWAELIKKNEASYFNKSMQLLTGLLATGNMPNLKALSETPSSSSSEPSSSSEEAPSSSSSSEDNTPIVLPQIVKNLENNATVQIYDLKGNRVEQLANLPKGLYIVRVISASSKQTFKIVVK